MQHDYINFNLFYIFNSDIYCTGVTGNNVIHDTGCNTDEFYWIIVKIWIHYRPDQLHKDKLCTGVVWSLTTGTVWPIRNWRKLSNVADVDRSYVTRDYIASTVVRTLDNDVEMDVLPGFRVVFGPEANELVEMMWTEYWPVTCEVVEVVHYHSHEQIDYLHINNSGHVIKHLRSVTRIIVDLYSSSRPIWLWLLHKEAHGGGHYTTPTRLFFFAVPIQCTQTWLNNKSLSVVKSH